MPAAPRWARGRKILVVEDEALIAMMLEDLLQEMGYATHGPASSVEDALGMVDAGGIDGAILDLDINGHSSLPVAEKLKAKGVPFAFTTGSMEAPPGMGGAPLLQKPYSSEQLRHVLDGFFQPA